MLLCPCADKAAVEKMLKKTKQFTVRGNVIMQWCRHLLSLPLYRDMCDAGSLAAYEGMYGIPDSVLMSAVSTQSKTEAMDASRLFAGDIGFANLDQSAAGPDNGRGCVAQAASSQPLSDADEDDGTCYVQRDMDLAFTPAGINDQTTLLQVRSVVAYVVFTIRTGKSV